MPDPGPEADGNRRTIMPFMPAQAARQQLRASAWTASLLLPVLLLVLAGLHRQPPLF